MRNEAALAAAIDWTIRLKDGSADDWRAFTEWLEADPAHLDAWDQVSLADDALGALPPAAVPAPEPMPVAEPRFPPRPLARPSARRWIGGGALAAALAGIVSVALLQTPARYEIETGPGERRQIALADGSRILLNGDSRIALDRRDARFARLERGQALFTVVHDASDPFEVEAGDDRLVDLGTVFDVVHEAGRLRVAVAEGAVLYNPAGERVRLDPGMVLDDEGGARVRVGQVETATVGGWARGRLSYAGAPLARVAADLSRATGLRVTVAPAIADRPFTGLIMLDPDRELLFERLSALLGVRAVRSDGGWTLTEGDLR